MTHFIFWKKYRPDLHRKKCTVFAQGRGPGPRNVGIEVDGVKIVMPYHSIRKIRGEEIRGLTEIET